MRADIGSASTGALKTSPLARILGEAEPGRQPPHSRDVAAKLSTRAAQIPIPGGFSITTLPYRVIHSPRMHMLSIGSPIYFRRLGGDRLSYFQRRWRASLDTATGGFIQLLHRSCALRSSLLLPSHFCPVPRRAVESNADCIKRGVTALVHAVWAQSFNSSNGGVLGDSSLASFESRVRDVIGRVLSNPDVQNAEIVYGLGC
ncbi:hypothetical protein B0H16DRAFT_1839442 [Mycena metata]|uniref:Uncharacterized protein n=1 Tax=Mycena metata TaxID=1033252 RepID=A0AAD7DRB9_9AGAR|nr:hypothetical protein B0H16DRAFT_1839442 [Mycena metata]